MKVDGDYAVASPRVAVYAMLRDPEALQRCLPGCERFVDEGEGRYETTLKTGIAGMKGTFTGTIRLTNEEPPERYALEVQGTFSGGTVKGGGTVTLEEVHLGEGHLGESGEETRVTYSGDVQIGGPLASLGQRLLGPATRMVANAFFACMQKQL